MKMNDQEGDGGPQECPYCLSEDDCLHLLLLVDRTFRNAEGGVLIRAFNERWSTLCELGRDDFDERESFENLLDEVDSCADYSADFHHEGGPGMSASYTVYYVESAAKSKDMAALFMNGSVA